MTACVTHCSRYSLTYNTTV